MKKMRCPVCGETDDAVTVTQAARIAKVSRQTVHVWIRNGLRAEPEKNMPGSGGRLWIHREDLNQRLAARRAARRRPAA